MYNKLEMRVSSAASSGPHLKLYVTANNTKAEEPIRRSGMFQTGLWEGCNLHLSGVPSEWLCLD